MLTGVKPTMTVACEEVFGPVLAVMFGQSGLGRENGIEAVHEYTLTKAVWVELSGGTRDPFTLG